MSTAVGSGPWLPAGPWPVEPGYVRGKRIRGWLLRCVALAVAIAYALYAQGEIADLARERAILARPDAVEVAAEFDGRVESRWGLFASYRGTVRFVAPGGVVQEGKVDFSTLTQIDTQAPVTVKFAPALPEQFVLSWAADAMGSRWVMLAILAGFGLLVLPGLFWWIGSLLFGQVDLALAVSVDGEQHVRRLVRVEEQKQYGKLIVRRYVVEVPTARGPKQLFAAWKQKEGTACLVPPDGVLVLSSPSVPKRVLVLRHDLWPLQLPDEVRQAVLQRLATHASARS